MPPKESLAAQIAAITAQAPAGNLFAWLMAMISQVFAQVKAYVLANADPRKLIDTPEERAAIEAQAIAGFDKLVRPALESKFGPIVAAALLANIEPGLSSLLDQMLIALAHTIPPAPAVL